MNPIALEALQKVGRNLVDLQRIEWFLKILVTHSKVEGSTSNMNQKFQSRKESIEKMTLGTVTNEYFNNLHSENTDQTIFPDREPFISFKVRFEMNKEQVESIRKVLAELVEERNCLVHSRLVDFDSSSKNKCLDLISDLDRQYSKIEGMSRSLKSQLQSVFSARTKAKKFIEQEFDRILGEQA